jgi:hypothetical protein
MFHCSERVIFMLKKNPMTSFLINLGLLLFGLAMVFSGVLIQFVYHMGHHGEIDKSNLVLGLTYFNWSDFHLISIVLVSIGMIFHVILHWKWYRTVVPKKKLVVKNQPVIILTLLFILVAITGYISWFMKLSGGPDLSRKFYIEIHDKITWVLLGYLIFHVTKRIKWYFTAFEKVKKYMKNQTGDKTVLNSRSDRIESPVKTL